MQLQINLNSKCKTCLDLICSRSDPFNEPPGPGCPPLPPRMRHLGRFSLARVAGRPHHALARVARRPRACHWAPWPGGRAFLCEPVPSNSLLAHRLTSFWVLTHNCGIRRVVDQDVDLREQNLFWKYFITMIQQFVWLNIVYFY